MIDRRVAAALVAVTLSGCQALPRAVPAEPGALPPLEAYASREAQLAALEGWTLRGRGALATDGRGWNGTVHWAQCADEFDLRFIAPLGAGTVWVSGHPGMMRLRGTDGTDFVSDNVSADLEHWLGTALPVEPLRWWVVGLPAPDSGARDLEIDAAGRATGFEQAGWHVGFPRYTTHAGRPMPALVVATRDGTRIRMVVDRWEPASCE